MTDPQRIARGDGFAAQLLRAGADEHPGSDGVSRTLAALGISSALLTSTTVVGAAAAGGKVTSAVSGGAAAISSATATGAVSVTLVTKWIGIGVISGVGFAGAASVVSQTAPPASAVSVAVASRVAAAQPLPSAVTPEASPRATEAVPTLEPALAAPTPIATPRPAVPAPASPPSESDLGVPLSAEVAFVDRGRALLRAGRTGEGLALLEGYEQQFSEARLLPEVLFLKLEACDRLGRTSEARRFAERLLNGFPQSPHAARARKLLEK